MGLPSVPPIIIHLLSMIGMKINTYISPHRYCYCVTLYKSTNPSGEGCTYTNKTRHPAGHQDQIVQYLQNDPSRLKEVVRLGALESFVSIISPLKSCFIKAYLPSIAFQFHHASFPGASSTQPRSTHQFRPPPQPQHLPLLLLPQNFPGEPRKASTSSYSDP